MPVFALGDCRQAESKAAGESLAISALLKFAKYYITSFA
jgi:hypothetical protein